MSLFSWWYLTPRVSIVKHPKPNLTIDISSFIEAGCTKENDHLNCSSIKLEEEFSCERIVIPSQYMGGLTPKVPIVECMFRNWSIEGFYAGGCLIPLFKKYIVLSNGEFLSLKNEEEFKKFFAPVETKEEALSFAVALTDSYPLYEINIPPHYVVFVPKIETTYVEEVEEGFKVHLFNYKLCGCGTHPHYAVDYLVTKTGEVKEIFKQKIYEDPLFTACVD